MVVVPEGGLDAKLVPRKKGGEEAASRATSGKNSCGFGKKEEGKGKVAAIATGGPALKSPVGDSATHPQKIQKERKNGWKNGAKKMKVAEKEENPSAEPHLETLSTAWGKGNVEPKLPMETLNTVKRKRKSSDVQNAESRTASKGKDKVPTIITGESALKSRVRDSTTHPQQGQEKNGGKNGAKMMKVVEEAEEIALKELPMETLNIMKRKRKSSDVQNADSHTASELRGVGVVWPTHIMEKPDSEFKEKLMRLLRKPFSQREYIVLMDKATARLPATKKKLTRTGGEVLQL
uniref:Uncharacterized protein n=1 Tax=Triticum urartu TaxID=4572 RepID=A0A8R7PHQ6_TRIUA